MCLFGKYLIVLMFYFYWSDIQSVNCADNLEFWDPEPKFNARRANAHRYKNVKDIPHIHHSHGSGNKSGHGSIREEHKRHKERTLRLGEKHGQETELSQKILRKRLRNRNDRQILSSTRITPMYLMQQSPEQTTSKAEDEVLKQVDLSSYVIARQMNHIMGNFLNANSTIEVIGRTAAYNDIVLVKITEKNQDEGTSFRADEDKYVDENPEKKIIFIVHALSTLGVHKLQCLTDVKEFSIIVSYYLEHLDKFDIFLIPIANPDGYASEMLYWNKNTSPQAACPGVHLDRNFDVAWNSSKVISSCSPIYAGSSPFSEPETKAIRDVLHHYSNRIIAYIHIHVGSPEATTYKGEAVLYPKGYTDVQTDDDKYLDLRGEIDEAMKNASFQITSVSVDTLYNWYGKVSGTSVDYASTVYGIPYAMEFVMQLYDNDKLNKIALHEIWKRVIDVIFNNIWKNIITNERK